MLGILAVLVAPCVLVCVEEFTDGDANAGIQIFNNLGCHYIRQVFVLKERFGQFRKSISPSNGHLRGSIEGIICNSEMKIASTCREIPFIPSSQSFRFSFQNPIGN